MAKKKPTFILTYTLQYEYPAKSLEEAVQLAKRKLVTIGTISNSSVVNEDTGEEVFI